MGLVGPVHRWKAVAVLLATFVLVASGCSKGRTTGGVRAYNIFAQKFRYHDVPASIPSGNIQINFSNKESFPIVHEMILAALPQGKTSQDLINSAKVKGCTGGGPCESQYLHFGEVDDVSTGATISGVFDLPPGQYFFACWQQGTANGGQNGPPHLSIGMVQTFTVT
jgi:Sulfocyanin (SoxE) domain